MGIEKIPHEDLNAGLEIPNVLYESPQYDERDEKDYEAVSKINTFADTAV